MDARRGDEENDVEVEEDDGWDEAADEVNEEEDEEEDDRDASPLPLPVPVPAVSAFMRSSRRFRRSAFPTFFLRAFFFSCLASPFALVSRGLLLCVRSLVVGLMVLLLLLLLVSTCSCFSRLMARVETSEAVDDDGMHDVEGK